MTISGLCKLTVIADKRATVQSTVVTKTCSSLISCSTIHELSDWHAWKCDDLERCEKIGRPFVCYDRPIRCVEVLRNKKKKKDVLGAQRTVRNEDDKTLISLGRRAESFVVSLLSDQLAQPAGTVNASY